MAELVGATGWVIDFRRQLLTFDRIALRDLETHLTLHRGAESEVATDLQFLVERGVIFQPITSWATASDASNLSPTIQAQAVDIENAWRRNRVRLARDGEPSLSIREAVDVVMQQYDEYSNRIFAIGLREVERLNAVPILSAPDIGGSLPTTRAEVIHLVLDQLPMPGPTHGLEDILAFRDEARAEGLIQGLRVWINELAAGKLTPIEVSDKLEDLMFRYERTMQLEKMERDTGVVETFVTTTAEIAEALVKFNWSRAAKKLFEVRHKQIDLMKAEMSAPGREVAYIVKARERFGR